MELQTLCTPCGSVASNLWTVEEETFVLSAETDCSALTLLAYLKLWAGFPAHSCTAAPPFCEPSTLPEAFSFSLFTLMPSASSQTQASYHKLHSPTYILTLLPAHIAS